jgi:DNA polymerase elongation subunit (family B)
MSKKKGNYLIFQANKWDSYHIDRDIDSEDSESSNNNDLPGYYTMDCYGKTLKGKDIYIKILGFTPHFYIKIPDEYQKKWGNLHLNKLINYLQNNIYFKYKDTLIKHDVIKRYDMDGFTNNKKFRYLRLIFNNYDGMKRYSWLFNKALKIRSLDNIYIKYKLYESNFEPMLRFYHIKNIKPSGWIKIAKSKLTKLTSSCYNVDHSYEVDWKALSDVPEYANKLAPLTILGYDIETMSGNKIDFPISTNPSDYIAMICGTLSYIGTQECFKKIAVVLGECDEKEDCDVRYFKTEKELLLGWRDFINEVRPDIITGYNTFGFDEHYIYDRCKMHRIDKQFLKIGKNTSTLCKLIKKELRSAALGDNVLRYINYTGIVNFDLIKVMRRDHNLSSYKLDAVAEVFINGTVFEAIPITSALQEEKYKSGSYTHLKISNLNDLEENNFIKIFEDGEKFMNGKKFKILNKIDNTIIIKSKIELKDNKKYTWALGKDDMPYTTLFQYLEGTPAQKKICLDYCFMDCMLLNMLTCKLQKVMNNIAMANVTFVPLEYIYLRGQGIKTQSKILEKTRREGYLFPTRKPDRNKLSDNIGYEGATVFPPSKGFYDRPIAVLDYASLYPSSMIMKNLSHETLVKDPDYDNLPGVKYYDCNYNNNDGTTSHVRFAKIPEKFGIIPQVEMDLLSERRAVKKQMKLEKDPFQKKVLDGKQLALKITANSVYGAMGAAVGPLYCMEIAAGTTSTGREMLELARDYAEGPFVEIMNKLISLKSKNKMKQYNKYLDSQLVEKNDKIIENVNKCVDFLSTVKMEPFTVYGDTDSIFVDYRIKYMDKDEYYMEDDLLEWVILLGVVTGDLVKKVLLHPQDLEYEKTFFPWFILSKKRYCGNKFEFDPKKFKQVSMGIVLKRRDNANIVKRVVGGLVDILLNKRDIELAIKFMKESIKQLLRGDYDIDEFITSKSLRGKYKGKKKTGDNTGEHGSWAWDDVHCSIAHVKLCQRMKERNPGNAPQSNDRIQYVAVYKEQKKGVKMLQGDKIETPEYILENDLEIDYLFYLTNQIMKPSIQFLELLMEDPKKKIFDKEIDKIKNARKGVQSLEKWFGKAKHKKITGITADDVIESNSDTDISFEEVASDEEDPAVINSRFVIKI